MCHYHASWCLGSGNITSRWPGCRHVTTITQTLMQPSLGKSTMSNTYLMWWIHLFLFTCCQKKTASPLLPLPMPKAPYLMSRVPWPMSNASCPMPHIPRHHIPCPISANIQFLLVLSFFVFRVCNAIHCFNVTHYVTIILPNAMTCVKSAFQMLRNQSLVREGHRHFTFKSFL